MKLILLVASFAFIFSCGSSEPKYEKTQVDILLRDLTNVKPVSIILYDMDASDSEYKHKYKVIKDDKGELKQEITPWKKVSERFFARHQDDMGMEIASKDSTGKVSKVPSPPGYSNHVGNKKYGSWQQQSNGTSFWQFYGQYAFMRSMLGMNHYGPVYYSNYGHYRSYHSSGRPYYGSSTNGRYNYGTRGTGTSRAHSSNTWSSKPSSFKQSVRSRVQRSSTSGSRTSRSGSRYSSGSSSRSRGGGFGK